MNFHLRSTLERYLPFFIIALVASLISGVIVARLLVGQDMVAGNNDDARVAGKVEVAPGAAPSTFADVAERVAPTVVKIETEYQVPEDRFADNPFFNDPFFRQFFRDFQRQHQRQGGLGSGFIFDERGYILTNEHVIRGADKIVVTIKDYDQPLPAKVVGSDFGLDLAVLKVEVPKGRTLPVATLGDSNQMRVGDWVVAIGDPYGQDWTVTAGIISAKGRPLTIPEEGGRPRQYRDLIQTDAAINPGNSGGPLINLRGEVIGINTAINAAAQGIGFAIPINTAREVLKDLMEHGQVVRAWLGISMYEITPDLVEALRLPVKEGVLIAEVVPNSPAEKAGLQPYD
ncbi:MAG: trypsin-like peptidase domain-containing protein, partial [Bacillota bacterium]|nr:trypsin-like peptidase domain-containing protein [Bacillota bacterium]